MPLRKLVSYCGILQNCRLVSRLVFYVGLLPFLVPPNLARLWGNQLLPGVCWVCTAYDFLGNQSNFSIIVEDYEHGNDYYFNGDGNGFDTLGATIISAGFRVKF